jgi:hypothetical protein
MANRVKSADGKLTHAAVRLAISLANMLLARNPSWWLTFDICKIPSLLVILDAKIIIL